MTLAQPLARYRILVLNSYHLGMTWEDQLNEGLLAELRQSGLEFDIFIEYMDTKRMPKGRLFGPLSALYADKYSMPPDVILATDDNAVDFLRARRDRLFPGIPVVFGGVNVTPESYHPTDQGFTGVTETVDIRRTIDLILKLHPKITQIIAIADATSSSLPVLSQYRDVTSELIASGASKVDFTEYRDWTFSELANRLKTLPPNTALLYLGAYRDRTGGLPPPAGGLSVLTENCTAPIYTLWQSHGIGDGAVGGFVADGVLHGRMMGQYAVRILNGASIDDLPVINSVGNRPIFDYHALMAHHIDLGSLPADSLLINEPQSFYYRYYKTIWVILGFVLLQTLVIAMLLWLINKSRRRERDILHRAYTELEQRVADRTRESNYSHLKWEFV